MKTNNNSNGNILLPITLEEVRQSASHLTVYQTWSADREAPETPEELCFVSSFIDENYRILAHYARKCDDIATIARYLLDCSTISLLNIPYVRIKGKKIIAYYIGFFAPELRKEYQESITTLCEWYNVEFHFQRVKEIKLLTRWVKKIDPMDEIWDRSGQLDPIWVLEGKIQILLEEGEKYVYPQEFDAVGHLDFISQAQWLGVIQLEKAGDYLSYVTHRGNRDYLFSRLKLNYVISEFSSFKKKENKEKIIAFLKLLEERDDFPSEMKEEIKITIDILRLKI